MSSAQCGVLETANMTCFKFTELLLSLLLLRQVCGQGPEIEFREEGGNIVMGYCFGADYIVVYRSAPGGEQLLGNSSSRSLANTPPEDLQGQIQMNEDGEMLGIPIDGLTQPDSGIYRRECWENQRVVKNHTEQLFVCKEEISAEEIVVNDKGGAEIRCNSNSVGLEGAFVRWYQELQPDYKSTLLLDSRVSLEPVIKEMRGFVEARENGSLLVVNESVLQSLPQFYCAVFKGETCLDFQNMHLPDHSESKEVFASKGERVVLNCTGAGKLQWDTPMREINSSTPSDNQMYLSAGKEPPSLSLIIPVVSDEHSGMYSCVAPTFEIQYSLFLCPKHEPLGNFTYEGEHVSLECSSGLDEFTRVLWYRHVQADLYEVIGDTYDESFSLPNDLKGRVELSDSGLLTISNLVRNDERTYRCVALKEFTDSATTEEYDYKEDMDEDDYSNNEYIDDTARCLLKREFVLNIKARERKLKETPISTNMEAVVGGLLGLIAAVAFVIVIVIVIKKPWVRNNTVNVEASPNDPGCTDSLKENGEESV